MARIIPLTVCVYIVNPEHWIFHSNHVPRMMKALLDNIAQPHEIRALHMRDPHKVRLIHLKPLTRTLNIVIIPDKKFYFDLRTHSDSIMLVVSVASGDSHYCKGIYYQALTLIRKYLEGLPVVYGRKSLYCRLKPAGKAIMIASMVDIENPALFKKLYADACHTKLIHRHRNALMHTIRLKKKLYLLNKERFNAGNNL
jgi:hypothetical protein